eukprot:scaffold13142_cov45-Prasinocladus_malaysianus.AAC.3
MDRVLRSVRPTADRGATAEKPAPSKRQSDTRTIANTCGIERTVRRSHIGSSAVQKPLEDVSQFGVRVRVDFQAAIIEWSTGLAAPDAYGHLDGWGPDGLIVAINGNPIRPAMMRYKSRALIK